MDTCCSLLKGLPIFIWVGSNVNAWSEWNRVEYASSVGSPGLADSFFSCSKLHNMLKKSLSFPPPGHKRRKPYVHMFTRHLSHRMPP